MKKDETGEGTASNKIDERIRELGDWRGETLESVRKLIRETDPRIVEEWKWRGVPVWSLNGILCTGETYRSVVKLTFAQGASLPDPSSLFNASLEGNQRRAIDLREGEMPESEAFIALVRAAIALNAPDGGPKLLSGGNPQIAKGAGDGPVQEYIRAMPGWKREVGARLDALIVRTVPDVRKAVKWNSPLYGMDGKTWFLGVHCYTKFIKVAFFNGASLDPMPPGASKQPRVRYLDLHEGMFDEEQLAEWIRHASMLPGEKM